MRFIATPETKAVQKRTTLEKYVAPTGFDDPTELANAIDKLESMQEVREFLKSFCITILYKART
jgi:hypothetical protein